MPAFDAAPNPKLKSAVKDRLDSLQAIRAFAAWMVATAHAVLLGGVELQRLSHLQAGVDIFFVLSGYVIARSLRRSPTALDFIVRRAWRIYPPYWLCTAALVAAELFLGRPTPSIDSVLSSVLLWPDKTWPILGVGWSLVHEVFFYTITTILLIKPSLGVSRFLGVWALITIVLAIGRLNFGSDPAWPWITLVSHPLNLEFIAGAFLANLHGTSTRLPAPKWSALVASVGFAGIACLPVPAMDGFGRPLTYGLVALLIVDACARAEERGAWRVPKWVIILGDSSYALYLIHAPLLAGIALAIRRWFPELPVLPILLIFLPGIQVLAIIFWQNFEKPMMAAAGRWSRVSQRQPR